ncbi:hypothetical protein [Phyllobacterium sp. 628]|uniref:hypothetical protein n=1 Tax=Phyllobacterium sp. 628 TaxID=2718938 RepID=UPI001FCEF07F|nr:hypothetical protein [Phyllobacterium sp. 628]
MSDLRAYQPSFTAGELSPALWARVDLAKYGSGLKTALNLFIHPHGGASNRAGLQFIREVKVSSNNAALIPFQFNTEQSYVLEFGDRYFRVFRNGGLILSGGGFPYETVTPYAHDKVADLVFIQEADVMYVCHPDYPVQKISRLADDNWTLTPVMFAPSVPAPTGLSATARYKFRSGDSRAFQLKVTAISAGGAESAASGAVAVSWQFENFDGRFILVSWNAVPGAVTYRVYRTDADVGIVAETNSTSADMPSGPGAFRGSGEVAPGTSSPGAPATPSGVSAVVVFGKVATYAVSAVASETSEESLPSAPFSIRNDMSIAGNKNSLVWNPVAGASAYIVYRKDNGVYGYVGRSETTSFVDENITPDIADGPQSARNPFNGPGNYPRCATFIEQRIALAGTKNDPQAVWMSQSANYENFGESSPSKASDAVTFRIKARQVNEIRSMLAIKGLMLLTSGSEWVVSGGQNSDAIAPSAIKIDNQGYRGAAKVQPIVVGNTVLFAQERGGVVRDFSYEFSNDSYVGRDLTIMARHLFEGRIIKSWCYAQSPYSIAWVILDDGSVVSLTYMKEHEVWAWTRHESGPNNDAQFESVCVVAEGNEDVPYFLVKRTIGGVSKRYIERLHTRDFAEVDDAFFVDSGLTYSGPPVTVIDGLDHLLGQSVVALADGNVVRNLTVGPVAGGIGITLKNAASKVHVGLSMVSALQTLDLDLGTIQGLGTVQGRMKSVSEVTMRVEKTRGIFVGPYDGERDSVHLSEYRQRSTENWNEAIALYTGDIQITTPWDWNTNGNVWIKQFDPLPMTILAIMPDVTIGR